MKNSERESDHQKLKELENIFPEMEGLLGDAEDNVLKRFNKPQKKTYFIIGCARSGTTLVYQYLAQSGLFSYPSNFISRFYYAPYIGARIQQMLIDADDKEEIFAKSELMPFQSSLGKAKGALQPHEFWYFWNRFFKFQDLQELSNTELNKVDWDLLNKELHAFESVYDKPILMKAMNLNWNLIDLNKGVKNIHFIFVRRSLLYNAQSLLLARERYFGDTNKWYSFKNPDYSELRRYRPEQQVVEQVKRTNRAIEEQLRDAGLHYSTIEYEEFCQSPFDIFGKLDVKPLKDIKTDSFQNEDTQKIEDSVFRTLVGLCG